MDLALRRRTFRYGKCVIIDLDENEREIGTG